jgi:hypothetical protein
MKKIIFILIISAGLLLSQEHQHYKPKKENADTTKHPKMEMETQKKTHPGEIHNRHGSGTAWLPDNSPMYGYMIQSGGWMYMIHGNLFVRYNKQDISEEGNRGDDKFDAPNWFMGIAKREIGHSGLMGLTAMLSFDPATIGGEGYPLLFQSGETWK